MSEPIVTNKYTAAYLPEEQTRVINIMRPSIYGNPYVVGRDGTRTTCIIKFKRYARDNPQLMRAIKELPATAILECCCKPRDCHGDAIVELWREFHGKNSV